MDTSRRMWHVGIGLGVGVLLILPTMLLAFISAGGGHGNYLWAKVFFPYSMILPVLQKSEISLPLIILAIVQYPIYGVLIGIFASSFKKAAAVVAIIGIVHVVAVATCLSSTSNCFS